MAWENDLTNEGLKSLVLEASSDSIYNYQEILAILESAAIGGITSSEWADLKSIYSNGSDSFSSSYLETITYNVIYTNPSNETWWGGVTNSSLAQPLGDMTSGTSEQNAGRLINKWFWGLDLPMPVAGGDTATGEASTGIYDYATANGQLFINGVAASDINQGATGDCYLLASMGAIANITPSSITDLFTDNGNGTYGVRFYLNGSEAYATVNLSIPVSYNNSVVFGSNGSHDLEGEMWVSLLEKAYMQLNTQADIHNDGVSWEGENSYQALEGGWASPIKQLTNQSYTYYSSYYGGIPDEYSTGTLVSENATTYKQTIVDALEGGSIGWLGSWGNTYDSSGVQNLVAGHAFMVLGYDSSTDLFTIRNPWGSGNSSYNGEFQASMTDFWNSDVKGLIAISDPVAATPNFTYTLNNTANSPDNAVNEGDEITFTITRSDTGAFSTVYLSTLAGSADAGDYQGLDKVALNFEAYETSKTISITPYLDDLAEGEESFSLELFENSIDIVNSGHTTAYIHDSEQQDFSYTITTEADSVETADDEGGLIRFTITRNGSGTESIVYLQSQDGTATSGSDYSRLYNYELYFAPYQTSLTVAVHNYNDSATEGIEDFSVDLYKNLSDGIVESSATAYIKDDFLPSYSYTVQSSADSPENAATEGSTVTFTLTRSGSGTESTVYVSTADAAAGSTDYVGINQQAVTFAANQKVATVEIETTKDWWLEADEYFNLNLFLNATDSTHSAYGSAYIKDDVFSDYNYTIDNNTPVTEGESATFTITRDGSGSASTVYLSTSHGDTDSNDFSGLDLMALEFAAYETSKTVTIDTYQDSDTEGEEHFWLDLYRNSTDSSYSTYSKGYIQDSENSIDYNYTVASDNSPVTEGDSLSFTITRDASGSASTVYISTTEDSASSGSDFASLSAYAVDFAAYETTKTITVDTYQDDDTEGEEAFWLDLYTTYADALEGNYATYASGTINDNTTVTDYNYTISSNAGYDSPALEGDEITFTITRDSSGSASSIFVSTSDSSAESGSDYLGLSGYQVDFAAYETTKIITIETYQDESEEYDEYFWLDLYKTYTDVQSGNYDTYSSAYITDGTDSGTSYTYSIVSDNSPVIEGNTLSFTVSRDSSGSESSIYLNTSDGSAEAGSDYAELSEYEVTFASYETSKTITIDTYQDSTSEGEEYFWLDLYTSYTALQEGDYNTYASGNIDDGDDVSTYGYTISSDNSPVTEGDSLSFTVTRDGTGTASSVYLSTSDNSAQSGHDYAALSAYELSFAAYETTKTINIDTYQDSDTEGEESFWLDLYTSYTDLQNGNYSTYSSGEISDSEITAYGYSISSDNSPASEGNSLSFTVTRDNSGSASTIYLNTSDGSAEAGSDYSALTEYEVNFASYETSKTIIIETYLDSETEEEEYFWLDLYTSYANLLEGNYETYASGDIKDGEFTHYTYSVSSDNSPVSEGNSLSFTVTRDSTGSASIVYISTSDGSAEAGADYSQLEAYTLEFAADESSKTITIDTYSDSESEGEEYFWLDLYTSYADLLDGNYETYDSGYIEDGIFTNFSYEVSSENSPVIEGNSLSFTVTRDGSGSASTIYLSTSDGTAEAGLDYNALEEYALEFAADETSKTITIETYQDIDNEGEEYFWLDLYTSYADLQDGNYSTYGSGYMEDGEFSDYGYTVSSDNSPVLEGETLNFTVTRDDSGSISTVYLSTSDGSTDADSDYEALHDYTLEFSADETSKTITINTYVDNETEGDEFLWLDLYKTYADLQEGNYYTWDSATITENTETDLNDDYDHDTDTTGVVIVNSQTTGSIEQSNDRDWFAVSLISGMTYQVALQGSDHDAGSLGDPLIPAIYSDIGEQIPDSGNDDGPDGTLDSFLYFTADYTGTHYIEANAFGDGTGNYTLSVDEDSSANNAQTAPTSSNDSTSVNPASREAKTSEQPEELGASSSSSNSNITSYPGHSLGMFKNDFAFAAITSEGSVITWGDSEKGGDSSSVTSELTNVSQICSNGFAFAALKSDGSVVAWGHTDKGGNTQAVASSLNGSIAISALYSTETAFAALREDGSVITWGESSTGGDSSSVASQLNGSIDITNISSNMSAFAGLRADGSVITWGFSTFGGDSSVVSSALDGTLDVSQIYSTGSAFAALRTDGSIITWGNTVDGGDSSTVATALDGTTNVTAVYATTSAFAALRDDGSVITWGDINNGGNSDVLAAQLNGDIDVTAITSTNTAFAALKSDGSVITWGNQTNGGDNSKVTSELDGSNGVSQIFSNTAAFAALREDGSVVTWGYDSYGGDQTSVSSLLDGSINVIDIVATDNAFAALRSDGSVVTWGALLGGGDSTAVASSLDGSTKVLQLSSTGVAFAALREDGSVVAWGDNNQGGNLPTTEQTIVSISGGNGIPIMVQTLNDLQVIAGSSFSYTVNVAGFSNIGLTGDISYAATLSNGDPLPENITFNTSNLTLSGTTDSSSLDTLTIRITATDSLNTSSYDELTLSLTAEGENITSTSGDDFIYGSEDTDTALVSYLPGQYIYNDGILSGAEGNDTLDSIEYIGFGYGLGHDAYKVDVKIDDLIDPDGAGDEKTNAANLLDKISDLYIAYFGRAPDASGFTYWFKEIYTGSHTFERAATAFSFSQEYQEAYPTGTSNRDFIETVYQNLFNRVPDTGGWDYWEGRLDDGLTRDIFLLSVVNGAYAPTSGDEDRDLLGNKHDVSVYYAEQSALHPDESFDEAINTLLNNVTGDDATETSARAVIDYAFDNDITLSGIMDDQTLFDQLWS